MDNLLPELYPLESIHASVVAFALIFFLLSAWALVGYLRNRKYSPLFVIALIASSFAFAGLTVYSSHNIAEHLAPASTAQNRTNVTFSPKKGTTHNIVNMINSAKTSIKVAAYSFSSKAITEALIKAHNRGVEVQIVLDKSQQSVKYSTFNELKRNNIPVRINSKYAIMHNKFAIIDSDILQTGSFNYTEAAENRNAENALTVIGDKPLVNKYTQEWYRLWNESAQSY